MTRGGKRTGSGRPKGSTKEKTVVFYRRVKPEWVIVLDMIIEKLKEPDSRIKEIMHNLGAHIICNHPDHFCEGLIDCSDCEYSSFYFE
jgi:hypothetical protein